MSRRSWITLKTVMVIVLATICNTVAELTSPQPDLKGWVIGECLLLGMFGLAAFYNSLYDRMFTKER